MLYEYIKRIVKNKIKSNITNKNNFFFNLTIFTPQNILFKSISFVYIINQRIENYKKYNIIYS